MYVLQINKFREQHVEMYLLQMNKFKSYANIKLNLHLTNYSSETNNVFCSFRKLIMQIIIKDKNS